VKRRENLFKEKKKNRKKWRENKKRLKTILEIKEIKQL